ncbi:MAG: hypothetical protein IPQ04_15430 [Saprospiraceae bacterium]|nr:hypothetical protein [Saprospiraceae bacterium]
MKLNLIMMKIIRGKCNIKFQIPQVTYVFISLATSISYVGLALGNIPYERKCDLEFSKRYR